MSAGDRTILQGGRAKAYRPMPPAARREAFEAGLAAYAEGDFFLAHELLEPPWMGTSDLPERELIQGVIKLAAAFVHDARSNATGIEKNLRGARARLAGAGASAGPGSAGWLLRVDVPALIEAIDRRLSGTPHVGDPAIDIPRLPRET
jgi:predicted metal-dependent hydrolase